MCVSKINVDFMRCTEADVSVSSEHRLILGCSMSDCIVTCYQLEANLYLIEKDDADMWEEFATFVGRQR